MDNNVHNDVKKIFALMSTDHLRQLAMQHNVNTGIKAPSSMRKAELIHALSEHYIQLNNTVLQPAASKTLEIPKANIPGKYLPTKIINKEEYKRKPLESDEEFELYKRLKEKYPNKQTTAKKAPYEIAREEREARKEAYTTDKYLQIAIKKRQIAQEKAREARRKKAMQKSEKPKEVKAEKPKEVKAEKPKEEEEEEHKIIRTFRSLLNRVKYIIAQEPTKDNIEYFDDTNKKIGDENNNYYKKKKTMTPKEQKIVDKLLDDIYKLMDEYDDKFNSYDD